MSDRKISPAYLPPFQMKYILPYFGLFDLCLKTHDIVSNCCVHSGQFAAGVHFFLYVIWDMHFSHITLMNVIFSNSYSK